MYYYRQKSPRLYNYVDVQYTIAGTTTLATDHVHSFSYKLGIACNQ